LTESSLLFDTSCILALVREFRGNAPKILRKGFTVSLAYYEIGNAIWRECYLLGRIALDDAAIVLSSIFTILQTMNVTMLEDDMMGRDILNMAGELGITYYDAAYLTMAQKLNKTLVTNDEELIKAAKKTDVKTLRSRALQPS